MKTAKPNSGLVIGAISTGISLCLTATYIVPIISVLPGVIIETIAANFVNNEPYSNVGKMTIKLLSVILIFSIILCMIGIVNNTEKFGPISQRRIIGIMTVLNFIVHPLGFYIYWALALHYRSDGQLIFAAFQSFPFSSLAFFFIGLLIDFVKNKAFKKYMKDVG